MPTKKKARPAAPARRQLAGEDEFRFWLRQLCESKSKTAVAKDAGISPSQLSQILSGRASLGPRTVARWKFRRVDTAIFIPMESEDNQ